MGFREVVLRLERVGEWMKQEAIVLGYLQKDTNLFYFLMDADEIVGIFGGNKGCILIG